MKKIQIGLPINLVIRLLIITIVATSVGIGLGFRQVYAETKNNLNVPGAGNVGTAATNGGNWNPNYLYAYGTTSSSINLFYLRAEVKFWHTGPRLQDRKFMVWSNSRGGSTPLVFTSGYGDRAATQSLFRYLSLTSLATYYTSWPGTTGSCYNFWNSGNPC